MNNVILEEVAMSVPEERGLVSGEFLCGNCRHIWSDFNQNCPNCNSVPIPNTVNISDTDQEKPLDKAGEATILVPCYTCQKAGREEAMFPKSAVICPHCRQSEG